jgi:hypothetical protein
MQIEPITGRLRKTAMYDELSRASLGITAVTFMLLLAFGCSIVAPLPVSAQENPREGWAVIMEMLDYPEGWTDLPTGNADSTKWTETLESLNWSADHISTIRDEITVSSILNAIEWLNEKSDENDVVLFFIFAHGAWLDNVIGDGSAMGDVWGHVPAQEKLMVFSSCHAGKFIEEIPSENPEVRVGSVGRDELAWAGGIDEGLPILGDVFNHYFTSAFLNETADTDENGDVSAEEAFTFARPKTQDYIQNVVFPAFPEYEELSNGTVPEPVMIDSFEGDLSLACPKAESVSLVPYFVGAAGVGVAAVVIVIFHYYRTKKGG